MTTKFRFWHKKLKEMNPVDTLELYWREGELIGLGDGVSYFHSVEEIILMQSTGLFDKNGVEIFEGDVVKRTSLIPGGSDMIGVVKMLEGCWVIDDGKQAVSLWTEVDENIVIGNIHQHPNLVED